MSARVRTRLAAVMILAAALTLWAVPAEAGGPTSVLLVAPALDKTASLYRSQPRYQQLETALEGGEKTKLGPAQQRGDNIVATWLIHDVSIWRVDRIFMDIPGGPWIATEEYIDKAAPRSGPVVSPTATWHQSSNPSQLRGLLKALGLYKASGFAVPGPAAPDPGQAAPAATTTAAAGFGTGWWWALPGLLAGALIALAGVRLKQPRSPYEKQQQLLDRPSLR